MKKVGIDARLYFQTGVGVYLRNFLRNLQKIRPANFLFYIYLLKNDASKIIFNSKNFIKRETNARWHTFSEQIEFLRTLYKDNLHLMHFTYFSYPVLYKRKFIATVHDTTPLLFKTGKASTNPLMYNIKHFFFKMILATQVERAKKIIVPTKTVKRELVNIYGRQPKDKTVPIYEGIDGQLINARENKSLKKNFPGKFLIYVGNFYPHKNVERLINGFLKVKTDAQLILIGPDDFFSKRLLHYINIMECGGRVVFYHNATAEDLVFFYKNASALIHPSLSEGFGLPLVEAAYFGCPIIASNISVFKEILDGQYLSFNPDDVEEITNKINYFLKMKPKFAYSKILKRYSFEKMTKEILEIYKNV
jgi:glycosyltransferase involved in cell wall biosynthesis